MSQSSKLNQRLIQIFGALLGIAIAVWIMRGLGVAFLTALPGGFIALLFLIAIAFGILSHLQKTWWRF